MDMLHMDTIFDRADALAPSLYIDRCKRLPYRYYFDWSNAVIGLRSKSLARSGKGLRPCELLGM